MMIFLRSLSIVLTLALLGSQGLSQTTVSPDKKPSQTAPSDSSKKDDKTYNSKESELTPRFDLIFDNPFLTQSLNAGSQVVNNAFDSLLEGIFYKLLDNKFTQKLTPKIFFNESLTRQVFTTGQGKYVIADRLVVGPQYLRDLGTLFKKLPVGFGMDADIDLLNIYLRSDPQRIVERETLPLWRYWVNQWFGIIPVLERMLPPSFDPNRLYDPLRQLETPFIFPTDLESFHKMKVGSIQSYAYQGSVSIPIGLDGAFGPFIKEELDKLKLAFTIPYTLFAQGEYRINVLKKGPDTAWVGLSKLKKGGHSLAGFAGSTIYLLANSLGPIPWKGVPAQFSPIDVSIVESIADRFDQIYEFDLSKPAGLDAYQSAIIGNFSFGDGKTLPDGVRFHFTQTTLSKTNEEKNSKNFILLYKGASSRAITKSEIKIRDEVGDFFVLENVSEFDDSSLNIFSGEQETTVSNELNLNVEKVRSSDFSLDDPKYEYRFHNSMKPYQLILKLQIKDRYADAKDFNQYIELLRDFTKLPLAEVPTIPLLTEKTVLKRQQRAFFSTPSEDGITLHATNTIVGKFNANALVIFDSRDLGAIIQKNRDEIRTALYRSYFRAPSDDLAPSFEYLRSYALYPLRIFTFKSQKIDGYREIHKALDALISITPQTKPVAMLEALNTFFKTDYPYELISTLYQLSDLSKIARNVTLYLSPFGDLDENTKKSLSDLNDKTFKSEASFPELERYRVAKNKLVAFVPTSLKDESITPKISKVIIDPAQVLKIVLDDKTPPIAKRFFLRVSSKGMFTMAQSNVGSKLLEIRPTDRIRGLPAVYAIPLFTPYSPLHELINTEHLDEETEYTFTISASELEGNWSEEFKVNFLYHHGRFDPAPTK